MRYPEELKEMIKGMEAILFDGICRADPIYRAIAISKLKDIKYKSVGENESVFDINLSRSTPAFFDPISKTIFILEKIDDINFLKSILIHEMCHAITSNDGCTGFRDFLILNKDGDELKSLYSFETMKNLEEMALIKNHSLFNESANEYFASSFYGERPVAYLSFLPIFNVIVNVCGYKETLNLFFNNDFEGLAKLAKDKFHLKDDYPLRLLSAKMDLSVLDNEAVNYVALNECYDIIMDMYVNKLRYEYPNSKVTDLQQLLDVDRIFAFSKIFGRDDLNLENYRQNLIYKFENGTNLNSNIDFASFKKDFYRLIVNLIRDDVYKGSTEEKQFMLDNLACAMTLFNQNFVCIKIMKRLSESFVAKKFFDYVVGECQKIDLNKYKKADRYFIVRNLLQKDGFDYGDVYKYIEPAELMKYIDKRTVKDIKKSATDYILSGYQPNA